jgi:hypothetical protein
VAITGKPTGFLDIEIVGNDRGVQAMLEAVDSALSPVGLAAFLYGEVGPYIKERAANRFSGEGDDVVGRWAPLQPATVDIRESQGYGGDHPINKRTGQLEEYITKGNVWVTTSAGVGMLQYPKGVPTDKALQQKMSTAQRGRTSPKTVARPVLGLNEKDLSVVLTMLAFHIETEGRYHGATP